MMESEYFQSKDYFSIENRSKAMLSFFSEKYGWKNESEKTNMGEAFYFPKTTKMREPL